MNIIQQLETSSANFWAGTQLTKAAFDYLKAERDIERKGHAVENEVLMDELAVITKTPEQRSADAAERFIDAGLVVYASYIKAKNSDSSEAYQLRNVKTPLEILQRSAEYTRNQQLQATAAALGLTYKPTESEMAIPPQILTIYKTLVEEIKSATIDDLGSLLHGWTVENKNRIVDSAKNLLDGARKRFEQGGYAGDPAELIELRDFVEKAAA